MTFIKKFEDGQLTIIIDKRIEIEWVSPKGYWVYSCNEIKDMNDLKEEYIPFFSTVPKIYKLGHLKDLVTKLSTWNTFFFGVRHESFDDLAK